MTAATAPTTSRVVQDRYGYFVRVNPDGSLDNLSAVDEAPVLPLREIAANDMLARRMARFLDANR